MVSQSVLRFPRFFKLLFLILLPFVFGCTTAATIPKEILVSIEKNPDWKIVEKCGDEDCYTLVDFMISKNMTFKVTFDNDKQAKQFFIIRTDFTSIRYKVQYTPSNIRVKLNNGEVLKSKVFNCYYTISDLEYLRSRPSLEGSFPVNKLDCYMLFFDNPALSQKDEAVMNMNDAFTINGNHLDMPLIHFKKNVGAQ